MSVLPLDTCAFYGRLRRLKLNEIRAADVDSDAATIIRSTEHIAQTREAVFTVDVQLRGESRIRQAGREARLKPGDFVMTDSTRTYDVKFESRTTMRLVRVPSELLKRYVSCPADMAGLRIDGSGGIGRIASLYLRSLWHDQESLGSSSGVTNLEQAVLEVLGSAYSQICGTNAKPSLASIHRMQIVELIERRLHDCSLTPGRLALDLRISPRHLHRMFSCTDETVSRYILRRRLERCAQQLSDFAHSGRHIGDIAYSNGFSTLPHFCRAFRETYSMSPGEYRRIHNEVDCGDGQLGSVIRQAS